MSDFLNISFKLDLIGIISLERTKWCLSLCKMFIIIESK